MSEHRDIPEPGELIYAPRPSWLPALLAFAVALAVCGIYAELFLVRGWVYSIIGVVVALFTLRLLTRDVGPRVLRPAPQAARSRRRSPSRRSSPKR